MIKLPWRGALLKSMPKDFLERRASVVFSSWNRPENFVFCSEKFGIIRQVPFVNENGLSFSFLSVWLRKFTISTGIRSVRRASELLALVPVYRKLNTS